MLRKGNDNNNSQTVCMKHDQSKSSKQDTAKSYNNICNIHKTLEIYPFFYALVQEM